MQLTRLRSKNFIVLKGENSLRMSSFEVWINLSLSLCWRSYIDCALVQIWLHHKYTRGGERSNCGIRSSESRRVFVCIHARHAENRINQLFCGEPRLIIINLNVCCGGCCEADGTLSATARGCQKWNCSLNWYANVKNWSVVLNMKINSNFENKNSALQNMQIISKLFKYFWAQK